MLSGIPPATISSDAQLCAIALPGFNPFGQGRRPFACRTNDGRAGPLEQQFLCFRNRFFDLPPALARNNYSR
jgi:hypothetical protein